MKTTENEQAKSGSWNLMGRFGALSVLVLGMVSCGSQGVPTRPSAGAAILDASAGHHENRMKNSRVVSINGVSDAGREAHVATGLTTATVRYNWPQGGAQEVDLKFRAVSDRKYFVKYAAFPPTVDQLRGTTALSTTAETLGETGLGIIDRSMRSYDPRKRMVGLVKGGVILSPAIVLGSVDYFYRVGQDIKEQGKPAQWVDMMVISESKSEGVVRFVRVYPSGHVAWQPWDAASNAPGNAQSGRALGRPASGGAGDQSDATFHRQASFAE